MATPLRNVSVFRWRWLVPVTLVVALFHLTPLGTTLDRAFFDLASRHPLRSPAPPDGSALVMMDNATLEMLSQQDFGVTWPPPRGVFAALVAALDRAGATRIVLDFAFAENSSAVEQDQFLGALAAGVPGVVLAHLHGKPVVFWDKPFVDSHPELFQRARSGSVAANTDSDGIIRRYHAPDSLVQVALDAPPDSPGGLLRWHGGLEQLRTRVPVLSAAPFVRAGLNLITRIGSSTSEVSPGALAHALAEQPALRGPGFDDVRGRVVFVGANAEGTFDQKPLAIGGLEPGVVVHWTAWANLVQGEFIQPTPGWLVPALAGLGIALIALMGGRFHGTRVLVLIAGVLALALLGTTYIGLSWGWYLPPATVLLALGLATVGMFAENYWTEHRRRREVQAIFGSYVAPDVVEQMVCNPAAIRLGGERREATVFFCDLAGFTDLSEQIPPEQLIKLVNVYLEETSDCLMAHGAYIDKFIGDAVMAVFGVPQTQPAHALAACRAALDAQRLLAARNVQLAAVHGRTLQMRIGLNTGELVVGNVGSERKKNYTVLGDVVNLASRLEGANKEFGTAILLGEATAELVKDELMVRPLTALRVKGRQSTVRVFELVGIRDSLTPDRHEFLVHYNAGHALYMARRFDEAVAALTQAATFAPTDIMTQRLLVNARAFATTPPPETWQPTLSLDTK